MASHPVFTTPLEERGLMALLADFNAERALQNPAPTPWTADQLHQELSKSLLDSYRTRGVETGGRTIKAALDAALQDGDTAKVAAVKIALGI